MRRMGMRTLLAMMAIAALLAVIPNAVEREVYAARAAGIADVRKEAVSEDVEHAHYHG